MVVVVLLLCWCYCGCFFVVGSGVGVGGGCGGGGGGGCGGGGVTVQDVYFLLCTVQLSAQFSFFHITEICITFTACTAPYGQ